MVYNVCAQTIRMVHSLGCVNLNFINRPVTEIFLAEECRNYELSSVRHIPTTIPVNFNIFCQNIFFCVICLNVDQGSHINYVHKINIVGTRTF